MSKGAIVREWELLRHVFQSNACLGPRVVIPPGDDMGAVTVGGQVILVTVDQVADGVHVDLATTPIEKVGRKAITRNLSDVAAMAAKPVGCVVAASLPRTLGEPRAKALFDAMRATAGAYDCPLFGGDVSMSDAPLLLTVTVLAEPAGVDPVPRSGARPGDIVYVTGQLGGSLETVGCSPPYTHHLDFEPRLNLARALASHAVTRPTSMMDLSDGLASDLRHLCQMSNVSARVHATRLPASAGCHQAAEKSGRALWEHAVGDGEDYELLFTGPPDSVPDEVDGVPITAVGHVEAALPEGPRVTLATGDGTIIDLAERGWEHRG